MTRGLLWLLIGALGVTVLVVYLAGRYPDSVTDQGDWASLASRLIWLTVLGGALAIRMRARPGLALRQAAIWIAIGAGLVLGYSFRFEAAGVRDRLLAEVFPSLAIPLGDAMTFRAQSGGQFKVDAQVDGVRVRFLVDTGASDVALTLSDAERIGIDPTQLTFNLPVQTANGVVYSASVRLNEVSLGAITIHDVAASVSQGELTQSLLGMTFLGRLSSYEITRDTLILRR